MWKSLLLTVWLACESVHSNISNNMVDILKLPSCEAILKGASSTNVVAPLPVTSSVIEGNWVSQGCETRAGPKFVTRSYSFRKDGEFALDLHIYSDPACREPAYSMSVEGKLSIERSSLLTPGATESGYSINRLMVVPHSNSSIQDIVEALHRSGCPPAVYKKMKPSESTLLYSSPWHSNEVGLYTLDCILISTWNELQLLRVEQSLKMFGKEGQLCRKQELFLGDLHSDPGRQNEYRPTAYQPPLSNSKCIFDCEYCKLVDGSSLSFPPILKRSRRILPPRMMDGSWTSIRCEVQRYGLFLTRFLAFSSYRPQWHLKQSYFDDPECKNSTYTIQASGTYKKRGPSPLLKADEYDLTITKMSITPNTKTFAAQLNRIPRKVCGQKGQWNIGKRLDITKTRGCSPIGLKVPSKEPEILRLEEEDGKIFMLLGQTPTWSHKGKGISPRPTSFSRPLQKCDENQKIRDNELRPQVGARVASSGAEELWVSWLWKTVTTMILFLRRST